MAELIKLAKVADVMHEEVSCLLYLEQLVITLIGY